MMFLCILTATTHKQQKHIKINSTSKTNKLKFSFEKEQQNKQLDSN